MNDPTTVRPDVVDAVMSRIRAALAENGDVNIYFAKKLGLTPAERRELFRRIAVEYGERNRGLS